MAKYRTEPVAAESPVSESEAPAAVTQPASKSHFRVTTKCRHGYTYPVMELEAESEAECHRLFCEANGQQEAFAEMVFTKLVPKKL